MIFDRMEVIVGLLDGMLICNHGILLAFLMILILVELQIEVTLQLPIGIGLLEIKLKWMLLVRNNFIIKS